MFKLDAAWQHVARTQCNVYFKIAHVLLVRSNLNLKININVTNVVYLKIKCTFTFNQCKY